MISAFRCRITLLVCCFALGIAAPRPAASALEDAFRNPPKASRPKTLWMWMNGNVTSNGISLDLEAMRRAGVGGALIFNIGEYIPKGPVDYGKEPWLNLMTHAASEADRLGLELAMHNCPGWSSSGGPWITPEMSMQQLVWSETKLAGKAADEIRLPQPFTRLDYYRDICVIAFPSPPGEEQPFSAAVRTATNARGQCDGASALTDKNFDTFVQASGDNPLLLEFHEPYEASAITLFYTSGGSTISFGLDASDDGVNFRPVTRLTPASPRAIEDASLTANFEPVQARFFRVTPSRSRGITEIELHRVPRVPAWNYKANFAYRPAQTEEITPQASPTCAIDPKQVIDLSKHMDRDGRLRWHPPGGSWTILRFGHTARAQENIASPDAGIGLECDKMSRAATEFHFNHGIVPLLHRLGPLAGKTFTALEVDSYEVGLQNWTSGFEKEFKKRNGYDLLPHLPSMLGYCVGDLGRTERFLWDLRRTHAELVADYYYGHLRELCRRRGLELLIEPYGAGPGAYDELQIAGRADIPMGEFWAHLPWDDTLSIRLAASAANVYGQKVVAGEAFTATEEQSRFLDYPYALKTTGDLMFSFGLNQMYFHRFAHQPHPSAVPGMTMGPWGFNFDRTNPWFEKSSGWLDYLARSQFLLRQGGLVADVLFFTGEGSPQMSRRHVPNLPPGYNFDAVNAEVLRKMARVKNGMISLSGETSYRLLMLPEDLQGMTPETMRTVRDLVANGAVLLGPKPRFSPTLRGYPKSEAEVQRIANEMWGDGRDRKRRFGKGAVFAGVPVAEVLDELKLKPDFEFIGRKGGADLVWLHRRADDAEIYFVANRQRRSEEVVCTFRVSGKQPELWLPETGEIRQTAVFDVQNGRTRVPMRLEPAESVFVIFRSAGKPGSVHWVVRDGQRILETDLKQAEAAITAPTNNFTISAWVKPDSDMMSVPQESGNVQEGGKGWAVALPDATWIQGEGDAAIGIAAGRNGVTVAERSVDRTVATLVSREPLAGWTHLAVVYDRGTPHLYLNGEWIREGKKSGWSVRPLLEVPPAARRVVYHFDGDMTPPEVFSKALIPKEVAGLFERGLPDPELPPSAEVFGKRNGDVEVHAWSGGTFTLSNGKSATIPKPGAPLQLTGPWHVSFPNGAGAPEQITLETLASLQRHKEPGVRFFSGTAVYRTQFEHSDGAVAPGRRLWLDLGRVSVMAEVRINGRTVGSLWKPPFRLDVTDFVRAGSNDLEVRVTNLLPNRLIGDEHLPEENRYNPRTRAIEHFPDWYLEGRPKPAGGRYTFSSWRFYTRDEPLVESGLLGPVKLLTSQRVIIGE